MLDKIITHFKNILFFKTVIYMLICIFLLILLPISRDNLKSAKERKLRAENFLNQATIRLSSLADFEQDIESVNDRFLKLVDEGRYVNCLKRQKFVSNVKKILSNNAKYSNIVVSLNNATDVEQLIAKRSGLSIMQYVSNIRFNAASVDDFIRFGSILTNTMPKNYRFISSKISSIKSLNPYTIKQLSEAGRPKLYSANIQVLISEIDYND